MEAWKEAYLKLQNGSDVRGVALESAAGEAVNLTENIAVSYTHLDVYKRQPLAFDRARGLFF